MFENSLEIYCSIQSIIATKEQSNQLPA